MPSCAVKKCGSSSSRQSQQNGTKIRFFSFPRTPEMQEKWLKAIGRETVNLKHARVCSRHFEETCYRKDWRTEMYNYHPLRSRPLFPESVPTLHLDNDDFTDHSEPQFELVHVCEPFNEEDPEIEMVEEARTSGALKRPGSEIEEGSCTQNLINGQVNEPQSQSNPIEITSSSQPIPKKKRKIDYTSLSDVQEELRRLQAQNRQLKKTLIDIKLGDECRRLQAENKRLKEALKNTKPREELEALEDEYLALTERLQGCVPKVDVVKVLRRMFTPGQIKAILLPVKQKIKWSAEDIASAISLRSVSVRAYEFLKNKRNIPLPGQSTLRKWMANMKLEEGILESVLHLMSHKAEEMEDYEKLVCLSFGEIDLSGNRMDVTKKTDRKRQCIYQCIMVRGLFAKWKQPVYYTHDKPLTKSCLLEMIDRLHEIGYTVISVITDMKPKHLKIYEELKVGINDDENCYFIHPKRPDYKIFTFIDGPSLLKAIRNYFLDFGFKVDGKMITKECIEQILILRTPEMKVAEKITQHHIRLQNDDRAKIKFATELFSNSVAKGIEGYGVIGDLQEYNWKETAEFINIIHSWFEVFNSHCKVDEDSGASAFGVNLDEQVTRVDKMSTLMGQIEGDIEGSVFCLQKNVIVNNSSLVQLFIYLRDNYSTESFKVQYLITNRLNMDNIHQLYSYLTFRENSSDKYNPLDFKHKLRWYMLGENTDSSKFYESENTEILTKDLWALLKKSNPLQSNDTDND